MTVHSETQTEQLEKEGRVETEVIGLRYTGNKSAVPPGKLRRQGGWPGVSPFQGGPIDEETGEREPGPIQIGINPDWLDDDTVSGGTLAGLEALGKFEVIYDPAKLARALLERNYLPPRIFGGEGISYNPDAREALFEKLGLEDVGTCPAAEDDYREQLAEIAGVELSTAEGTEDSSRVTEYLSEHSRRVMKAAVEELDVEPDGETKHAYAEALADVDPAEARGALEDAEARN